MCVCISVVGQLRHLPHQRVQVGGRARLQTERRLPGAEFRRVSVFLRQQQGHDDGLQARGAGGADEVWRRRPLPARWVEEQEEEEGEEEETFFLQQFDQSSAGVSSSSDQQRRPVCLPLHHYEQIV